MKLNYPEIYNNIKDYLNWNTEDTIRKITNRKRFIEVVAWTWDNFENYMKKLKINEKSFDEPITPDLVNIFTKINNLFVKQDSTNALSMLETTKEPNWEKISDKKAMETTIFQKLDRWIKQRKWYNIIQWASENMFTQAIQKKILNFNEDIENLITK